MLRRFRKTGQQVCPVFHSPVESSARCPTGFSWQMLPINWQQCVYVRLTAARAEVVRLQSRIAQTEEDL